MNNRGSVLVATLGLVLIFLLFGLASIHHAGEQNLDADRRQSSVEAFWMAEAGLEVARSKLGESPVDIIAPDKVCMVDKSHVNYPNCGDTDSFSQMDNGELHVYSEQDPDCPTCIDRWHIRSYGEAYTYNPDGSVNSELRGIDALAAYYDIDNAITTHGTVNGSCVAGGSATITGNCIPNHNFTLFSIFGMTLAELTASAQANALDSTSPAYSSPGSVDHEFHLSSPSQLFEVDGVTVIYLEGNLGKMTINTDDPTVYAGPTLLIVDSSGTSSPQSEIKINGGAGLCGVIWSIGEATINGTSVVRGAVFIDGSPVVDNAVLGNTNIIFDPVCVDLVAGGYNTGTPGIIAWEEFVTW